ncbi:uncharacterized protein LOC110837590 [Zootermopsis nevadensis]|uniref:uncharacterized protein LOC110837590 n=1 Tax=Zootermopsis nevadensis TaxID=136037 RepID=UPI000B8E534C|nr:uncharacterized protein LOC110837590 [Zootermopsis nevadensis]
MPITYSCKISSSFQPQYKHLSFLDNKIFTGSFHSHLRVSICLRNTSHVILLSDILSPLKTLESQKALKMLSVKTFFALMILVALITDPCLTVMAAKRDGSSESSESSQSSESSESHRGRHRSRFNTSDGGHDDNTIPHVSHY